MKNNEAVIVVDYQNTFVPVDEGWTWELWVAWWGSIAPYINKLTSEVREKWWLIINTRDIHPVGHVSLASTYKNKIAITEAFAQWINPNPLKHPEYFVTQEEVQNWNPQNNGFVQWEKYDYEALKSYLSTVWVQALWPDHAMSGTESSKLFADYNTGPYDIDILKWNILESDSYSWFGWSHYVEWEIIVALTDVLKSYNIEIVNIVWLATDYCVWETAKDAAKNGFDTRVHTQWIAWVAPDSSEAMLQKLWQKGVQLFD